MSHGTLVSESLRLGGSIDEIPLTTTKLLRIDAGDVGAGQPKTWTLIEFEFSAEELENLIGALERALDRDLGWYCDLHTPRETIVVFSGRTFRYSVGDEVGRAAAAEYARVMGVPEPQLDWPE